VVTLFTSPPDLSVVFFSLFCLFVFVVVCLVLLSLVAAAFLANKDVYKLPPKDFRLEPPVGRRKWTD